MMPTILPILQLASQLQAAEEQNKAYAAQREQVQEQYEKYQRAVNANPVIEQQMDALSRDYDNEQLRYRELREKKDGRRYERAAGNAGQGPAPDRQHSADFADQDAPIASD